MQSLIDFLSYQAGWQRWAQFGGALALTLSAIMVFALMVELERKPMLDKALTVKQFALALVGAWVCAALAWQLSSMLAGTLAWDVLGVASFGVMVETIRERRRTPAVWEDPWRIIADQQDEINRLRARLGEQTT